MNIQNIIRKKYLHLLILLSTVCIIIIYHAPADLDERDQARQGLYINDLYYNGNFVIQYHRSSSIETKPPLYNWLAYPFSVFFGGTNKLVISLPSLLATVGVLVLIFYIGKEISGRERVGFMAATILLSNNFFLSLSRVARTDMVLTFFIALTLFLFIKGYNNEKKRSLLYHACYVAMGFGTLTKGPVAFILPVGCVFFYLLLKKDLRHLLKAKLPTGLVLYVLIIACWLVPAWIIGGREVYEVMFVLENVQKFFGTGERATRIQPPYLFLTQFLNKFKPWWIFMPFAFVRWKDLFRKDRTDLLFPIVWFAAMLLVLSVSSTKRHDHLLPLMPAASLIVAVVIDRFFVVLKEHRFAKVFGYVNLFYGLLFVVVFCVLGVILVFPQTVQSLINLINDMDKNFDSSYVNFVASNALLFLIFSLFLIFLALLVRRYIHSQKGTNAFFAFCFMMFLLSCVYLYSFTPAAVTGRGNSLYRFSKEAKRYLDDGLSLYFRNVPDSIVFYFGKNSPNITKAEVMDLISKEKPFSIVVGSIRNKGEGDWRKDLTILVGHEISDKKISYIALMKYQPGNIVKP